MNNPTTPKLFIRSDFFMFPIFSATCLYMNLATKGPHEGFSSPLGLCFGLIGGGLIGLFFRQGWTYRQSIPGIPSVKVLKARHSWSRLFHEKKLFTGTEFLLLSAIVTGIFIVDKITTGRFHNSMIINLILCLGMFTELLRRQYWRQ